METVDVMKPLFYLSRVIGLAPYTLYNNDFHKSRTIKIYSQILTLIMAFFQAYLVVDNLIKLNDGVVKSLIFVIDSFVFSINCFVSAIILWCKEDFILDNFLKLDLGVRASRSNFKVKRLIILKRLLYIICIHIICYAFIFLIIAHYRILERNQSSISLLSIYGVRVSSGFCLIVGYVLCFQSVTINFIICLCFESNNEKLVELMSLIKFKRVRVISHLKREIKSLVMKDELARDATDGFGSVYSVYSLSTCVLAFLEILYFFDVYFTLPVLFSGFNFANACLWLFYFVSQFVIIISCSMSTMRQAEKTANYLHELFIDNDDTDLKEEIEIFSLQLLHRKVEFNACGFFKLDFSLLYSMVGAVTTYIIILMQFQGDRRGTFGSCQVNCTNCSM